MLRQDLNDLGNAGTFLADGHVNAVHFVLRPPLSIAQIIGGFLVQNGVNRHRSLTGLAVTNDQFPLPPTNRNQGVNRLNPRLNRLMHRLARHDARRLNLNPGAQIGLNGALAVNRLAQAINHPTQQGLAHWHINDVASPTHQIALFNAAVIAKNDHPNIVLLQVQRHPLQPIVKGHHFPSLHPGQAVDAGDTITNADNLTNLGQLWRQIQLRNFLFQQAGNF